MHEQTKFSVPPGDTANFNRTWREALRTHFKQQEDFGGEEFLDDWLRTGKSFGRTLRFQVGLISSSNFVKLL